MKSKKELFENKFKSGELKNPRVNIEISTYRLAIKIKKQEIKNQVRG